LFLLSAFSSSVNLQLDFDIYAGWQVQFHQSVNCFSRRLVNVDNPAVRAGFKVFARIFVYVGRSQQAVNPPFGR
jgi:hypothetical protein